MTTPHPPSPSNEGHYVATSLAEGVQVAYDWFAVRPDADGLLIESRHTVMGVPSMPVQQARFAVAADWTPRRISVSAERLFTLDVEFGEQAAVMKITDPNGARDVSLPIPRRRALFLLNGGLYFPLHIVRRFRFEDPAPQQFDIIPAGIAEVTRLEDAVEDGRVLRRLEAKISGPGFEDVLRLFVNERGDMVRYHARGQNVAVTLEEGS